MTVVIKDAVQIAGAESHALEQRAMDGAKLQREFIEAETPREEVRTRWRLRTSAERQEWMDAAFIEHREREPWVFPTIDRHKLVYLAVKHRPDQHIINGIWNRLDPVFEYRMAELRGPNEKPMNYRELGIFFESIVVSPYFDDLELNRRLRFCVGITPTVMVKTLRELLGFSRVYFADRMHEEKLPYEPKLLAS